MIWQNYVIMAMVFLFFLRVFYKMGYKDGKAMEAYKTRQKELEKSGDFFWLAGHRVPRPPRPKDSTLL